MIVKSTTKNGTEVIQYEFNSIENIIDDIKDAIKRKISDCLDVEISLKDEKESITKVDKYWYDIYDKITGVHQTLVLVSKGYYDKIEYYIFDEKEEHVFRQSTSYNLMIIEFADTIISLFRHIKPVINEKKKETKHWFKDEVNNMKNYSLGSQKVIRDFIDDVEQIIDKSDFIKKIERDIYLYYGSAINIEEFEKNKRINYFMFCSDEKSKDILDNLKLNLISSTGEKFVCKTTPKNFTRYDKVFHCNYFDELKNKLIDICNSPKFKFVDWFKKVNIIDILFQKYYIEQTEKEMVLFNVRNGDEISDNVNVSYNENLLVTDISFIVLVCTNEQINSKENIIKICNNSRNTAISYIDDVINIYNNSKIILKDKFNVNVKN